MKEEKELNLIPIIKKVLEKDPNSKFYSSICGYVSVIICENDKDWRPIKICTSDRFQEELTAEGKFYTGMGECVLFPSKENKDWSTMIVPQNELKPFDRVLVRDSDNNKWTANIYSHNRFSKEYPFGVMSNIYKQCIPYEGNEELLGTTNNPRK